MCDYGAVPGWLPAPPMAMEVLIPVPVFMCVHMCVLLERVGLPGCGLGNW